MFHLKTGLAGPTIKATLFLGILSVLVGCFSKENDDNNSEPSAPTLSNPLDGIWFQEGYGQYLVIENDSISTYQASSESCIATEQELVTDWEQLNELLDIRFDENDLFSMVENDHTLYRQYWRKQEELPESCQTLAGNSAPEVLKHYFAMAKAYYGFEQKRGIDLSALETFYLGQVSENSTDEELVELFTSIVTEFNGDGHVWVLPEKEADMVNFLDKLIADRQYSGLTLKLASEFESQGGDAEDLESFAPYYYQEAQRYYEILYSYFTSLPKSDGEGETLNDGKLDALTWAKIGNELGYIYVDSFLSIAPNTGSFVESDPTIHLPYLNNIMDEIIQDFDGVKGLIIDQRKGGGGSDQASIMMLRRFLSEPTYLYQKYANGSESSGIRQEVEVDPYPGPRLEVPIVVITSSSTGSGSEVFTLAARALQRVTHIGENTSGAISDTLPLELPNGWHFTLSHEVYEDVNGKEWEATGIDPHEVIELFSTQDREQGIDSALEAAINILSY